MVNYKEMKLNNTPFLAIEEGKKTVEVRLLDEKRRELSVGDIIIFTHRDDPERKLFKEIKALHTAADFRELFLGEIFPLCGFGDMTPEEAVMEMCKYYSAAETEKYGAVGIELAPVVNIHSKGEYPANMLSNFYPHPFTLDGLSFGSMEGFLQSLKCRFSFFSKRVARLSGKEAKEKGARRLGWKKSGILRFGGKKILRESPEYTALITRAYEAMNNQNPELGKALAASKPLRLIHSIGKRDPKETVLTEQELISQLEKLRG